MHPAQRFLVAYAELARIDRQNSRRDLIATPLVVVSGALNIYLFAWAGTPWGWLNVLVAVYSALIVRRIWLWRLARKADMRRLSYSAYLALEYLTPTTEALRVGVLVDED